MKIEKAKRDFLEYMEIEKGLSIKTVTNYDRYLSRFFEYSEIEDTDDITEEAVKDFRLWLNRQKAGKGTDGRPKTLKHKTVNYYLVAIRAFLRFLRRRGIEALQSESIELAKAPDRDLDLITAADLDRLMQTPEGDSLQSLRDRAILELLFSTGLRVSELAVPLSRLQGPLADQKTAVRTTLLKPPIF